MISKFQIKRASDGQFYFNLKARNGEIILTSESYRTESAVKNGIESVRLNAPRDELYERKIARPDKYYFLLKAENGEVIGSSEIYSSKKTMENGIASVKENTANAEALDLW